MSDTFGIGQGVSAAASLAGTTLQVNALEKARAAATQAGQTAFGNISQAGQDAQNYYDPYVQAGTQYLGSMTGNSAYNTTDDSYIDNATKALNEDTLKQTPGYQWNLSQGTQAATNSAAARGLANSGAALKGISTYASGLADSTYQNQFNDQLSANTAAQGNLTNTFNRQNALLGYGYQAAGASAANNLNTSTAANQALLEGATGSVAATTGIGNALQGGLQNIGNAASNYGAISKYGDYLTKISGKG